MELSTSVLGSTTVDKLKETASGAVLHVGKDKLTRHDLAGVECFNFHAAKRLGHILTDVIGVKSLKHVYDAIPPAALAVPQLGVFSLAVLGAAFESKGLGTLESYVRKHQSNGANLVTFHTLKHREQAEVAREKAEKKKRARARNDTT